LKRDLYDKRNSIADGHVAGASFTPKSFLCGGKFANSNLGRAILKFLVSRYGGLA